MRSAPASRPPAPRAPPRRRVAPHLLTPEAGVTWRWSHRKRLPPRSAAPSGIGKRLLEGPAPLPSPSARGMERKSATMSTLDAAPSPSHPPAFSPLPTGPAARLGPPGCRCWRYHRSNSPLPDWRWPARPGRARPPDLSSFCTLAWLSGHASRPRTCSVAVIAQAPPVTRRATYHNHSGTAKPRQRLRPQPN